MYPDLPVRLATVAESAAETRGGIRVASRTTKEQPSRLPFALRRLGFRFVFGISIKRAPDIANPLITIEAGRFLMLFPPLTVLTDASHRPVHDQALALPWSPPYFLCRRTGEGVWAA